MKIKLYVFKCPSCGKVITSENQSEVRWNASVHLKKHDVNIRPSEVELREISVEES